MKHYLIVIVVLALLGGCGTQQTQQAQKDMVGMSKKELLLCAGVPDRQDKADDLEFLTYAGDEKTTGGIIATSQTTAVHVSHKRTCAATFVIKDEKIQQIKYKGRESLCASIIDECIK